MPGSPLRVRVVDRSDPSIAKTPRGYAEAGSVREFVARDLASDLVRVLSSSAVEPGDVAVLVRTNKQAVLVRDALDAVAIPSVINGAGLRVRDAGPRASGCGCSRRWSVPPRPCGHARRR